MNTNIIDTLPKDRLPLDNIKEFKQYHLTRIEEMEEADYTFLDICKATYITPGLYLKVRLLMRQLRERELQLSERDLSNIPECLTDTEEELD